MNTWEIHVDVDKDDDRWRFIQTLSRRGFVVKLGPGQPAMYKTFGTSYCYTVSHKDTRALTMFLLVFDARGLDMRIIEL
jgi:hypothetical protein